LKFGERAKRIENKAVVNAEPSRLDLLIETEKFRLKADRLERRVALLEHFIQSSRLQVPMASQLDSRRQSQRLPQLPTPVSDQAENSETPDTSQTIDDDHSSEQPEAEKQPVDAQTAELLETLVQEYEEQVVCSDQLGKIQTELQLLHRLRVEDAARTEALQQQHFDLLQETRRLAQEKKTLECSLADLVVENHELQEQVDICCAEISLLQAKLSAPRQTETRSKTGVSQLVCSLALMHSHLLADEEAVSNSRSFGSTSRSLARSDFLSQSRLFSDCTDSKKLAGQSEPAAAEVIVPMTVSILKTLSKTGQLRVDGKKLRRAVLVARLVRLVQRPHFCTLVCEDSSGTVELLWQQPPAATELLWRENAAAPRLAKYYRLQLVAKQLSETCIFVVDKADLLTDLNLLTNHLLSVMHAALSIRCSLRSS